MLCLVESSLLPLWLLVYADQVQVSCLAVGQDRENPAVVVNEDYGYLEDADNRGMLG